ncbi:Putative uncharacterized Fe-S oxidoreductase (contains cysteine-rich region domain) [Desulfatibacillum aliphaticivorans]|uniref:Uncharacterized Fe-S oxidoreductase (Contains cysteine-rich region domain) n=1 Tax=Desulfatibacillum aliphaticivorans TaxID=218208 RepID=B8FDJ5_DESAL|nr:(Fe-S)-binding protein [Desulfatibacillum aliphaticivorans]ACL06626.1 Putative uncharacterized Fe-S oxidoreductase (contains cysteine-rich region domain) [Desulfatibacillum aliphaticivorans]
MNLDKLKPYEAEMKKCFRCSLCKMVPLAVYQKVEFSNNCPINNYHQFHAWSGSGLQFMALSLLHGRIPADEKLAEIVFSCRSCGYCDVACKYIMDAERHQVNTALKETLALAGLAPPELGRTCRSIQDRGTPFDSPAKPWDKGLSIKKAPRDKAKVLLWAGCSARHDPRQAAAARLFARILQNLKVDFAVLQDEESCCGLPAYWSGFGDVFTKAARDAGTALERSGARTVVCLCGACLGAMRSKYPAYGVKVDAEILHATEFLDRVLARKRLNLQAPEPMRVTYHDPCYLGRQAEPYEEWNGVEKTAFGQMTYTDPPKNLRYGTEGVFDAPRSLLHSIRGLQFNEMHRIREYALCCGAGGGLTEAARPMARQSAVSRLEEAKDVGAQCLVTACPHCRSHLEASAREAGLDVRVADIMEILAQALGVHNSAEG